MARLIDADRLSERLKSIEAINGDERFKRMADYFLRFYVQQLIYEAPTVGAVGAVNVVHGAWKACEDESGICATEFVCSTCGESFCSGELTDERFVEMMKYCPNCGAKMDGKVSE